MPMYVFKQNKKRLQLHSSNISLFIQTPKPTPSLLEMISLSSWACHTLILDCSVFLSFKIVKEQVYVEVGYAD